MIYRRKQAFWLHYMFFTIRNDIKDSFEIFHITIIFRNNEFYFIYLQFYLVMKGQGLANDTTERSKNGPGKFIASKVRASSQAALTAAIGQSSNTQQTATNNVPISSIGLSETSKLSEKDIQVCNSYCFIIVLDICTLYLLNLPIIIDHFDHFSWS